MSRSRFPSAASYSVVAPFLLVASLAVLGCTDANGRAAAGATPPLERGKFYIELTENLEGRVPEDEIAEFLITKQLLLHGFHRVDKKEEARFVITGSLEYTYHKELTFDYGGTSQHLEHQFKALAELTLTDTQAAADSELRDEWFDFPEPGLINGRTDRKDARRDIRRLAATKLSERIVNGKILQNKACRDLEYALGDPFSDRTFNDVISSYVKLGRPAVPYLLMLLLDDRPVRLSGEYPGSKKEGAEPVLYYHIADKALGEILMRESGLDLESTETYLKRVITGWYWAWEDAQGIPKEFRTLPEKRADKVPAPVGG
ncbi:MAG: hypothetical protein KDC38_00905 [Planctomycetes bacterium]|nr:hypothetical protein [Planctomycetota bacterium]